MSFYKQISPNLHLFPFTGMNFTLKIDQSVAGISVVCQLQQFFYNLILGRFFTFGPVYCVSLTQLSVQQNNNNIEVTTDF